MTDAHATTLAQDTLIDDDGAPLASDAAAELAALDAEEAASDHVIDDAFDDALGGAESTEDEEQARLDGGRARCGAVSHPGRATALPRYRAAVLAAEPELPPDLVNGDTLEELDESVAAARSAVARIRDRLQAGDDDGPSGASFPVGAPARGGANHDVLTSQQKIATGLRERER